MKSPTSRHSSFSPGANTSPVISPQSGQSAPKWKAKLKERNRLSAPPLHSLECARSAIAEEDVNAEEKIIKDEYNPLFESMTQIEYNPQEDDLAAQVFGRESNFDAKVNRQSEPAMVAPNRRQVEKRTSGYDFDALLADM